MEAEICAHEACDCAVTGEAEFCSAHCEAASQASQEDHDTCECGHADCGG